MEFWSDEKYYFSCSSFFIANINRDGDIMGEKDDAIDNTGFSLMTSFVSARGSGENSYIISKVWTLFLWQITPLAFLVYVVRQIISLERWSRGYYAKDI